MLPPVFGHFDRSLLTALATASLLLSISSFSARFFFLLNVRLNMYPFGLPTDHPEFFVCQSVCWEVMDYTSMGERVSLLAFSDFHFLFKLKSN